MWCSILSVCLRFGFWCQHIWFGFLVPGWFYQMTDRAQPCGFGIRVSLLDFCPWWSYWSPLQYLQKCTASHQSGKTSRLKKHNRRCIIDDRCTEFESSFGSWCVFPDGVMQHVSLHCFFKPATREIISDSLQLCETEVCFLHVQLMGTNVWLPKTHKIHPDVDFESSRSPAKSESCKSPSLHCCAEFPTWQYLFVFTRMMNIWNQSS